VGVGGGGGGGGGLGQLHDLHKQLWKEKSTSLLHMNLCNFPDVTALFDAQNAHVIGKVQVFISHWCVKSNLVHKVANTVTVQITNTETRQVAIWIQR